MTNTDNLNYTDNDSFSQKIALKIALNKANSYTPATNPKLEMTTEMARRSVALHRISNKLSLSGLSAFDPDALNHSIEYAQHNGTYKMQESRLAKQDKQNASLLNYSTFEERDKDLEKLELMIGREIEDRQETYSTDGIENIYLLEEAKLKNRIKDVFTFRDNVPAVDAAYQKVADDCLTQSMQKNFDHAVFQRKQNFMKLIGR